MELAGDFGAGDFGGLPLPLPLSLTNGPPNGSRWGLQSYRGTLVIAPRGWGIVDPGLGCGLTAAPSQSTSNAWAEGKGQGWAHGGP